MASSIAANYVEDVLIAPFRGKTPQEMRDEIDKFFKRATDEHGRSVFEAEDRRAIARGAFLTQHSEALDFGHDPEKQGVLLEILRGIEKDSKQPEQPLTLSDEEVQMISWETDKKIKQSGTLVWLIVCCSLGAATQGMNEVCL